MDLSTYTHGATLDDIKRAHTGHWFDNKSWHGSRVHSQVYSGPGGVYFVSSEAETWDTTRAYTVRKAETTDDAGERRTLFDGAHYWRHELTGDIETVGEYKAHATRHKAHKAARELAAGTLVELHKITCKDGYEIRGFRSQTDAWKHARAIEELSRTSGGCTDWHPTEAYLGTPADPECEAVTLHNDDDERTEMEWASDRD